MYTEDASFTVTHIQYNLQYMVGDVHLLIILMDLIKLVMFKMFIIRKNVS
jgi:hypothetical protein